METALPTLGHNGFVGLREDAIWHSVPHRFHIAHLA